MMTLSDSLPPGARAAAAISAPLKRRQKPHSPALASRRGIGKYPPLSKEGQYSGYPLSGKGRNGILKAEFQHVQYTEKEYKNEN